MGSGPGLPSCGINEGRPGINDGRQREGPSKVIQVKPKDSIKNKGY